MLTSGSDPFQLIRQAENNSKAPVYEEPGWAQTIQTRSRLRWNQLYPYELIVLERVNGAYQEAEAGTWRFTLPIPPESLSVSTPFAISTAVTLGGVVEEHNGAPIRVISLQGTTGVLPLRGTAEPTAGAGFFSGIAGGTIRAASRTLDSFNRLLSNREAANLVSEQELSSKNAITELTGYFQFRLLQQFLESYVAVKKQARGRNLRLALAMWKDEAIYLVTPLQFEVRRSAPEALEYRYSLAFKAWSRISMSDLEEPAAVEPYVPVGRDPSTFKQALNKLQEARQVLQGVQSTVAAVRGDVNSSVFEPLREIVLFCKDAIGVAPVLMDLPKHIIKDMKGAVAEAMSLNHLDQKLRQYWEQTSREMRADLQEIRDLLECRQGETDPDRAKQLLDKFFEDPAAHPHFFSAFGPDDLNLSRDLLQKIKDARGKIRDRAAFERARDSLLQFEREFADSVGAGSRLLNEALGYAEPVSTRTPSLDEYETLYALNDVVLQLDKLAVSATINGNQFTTLDYVAGAAAAAGIAFKKPLPKFAVPFPYGNTLEMLAARYLGDPQRWLEIAALNGLQSPYVDEVGFTLPLLVNGREDQIVVEDASRLCLGQSIWIESTNTTRTRRRITAINRLGNGYAVTVSGDRDMDRYSVLARAQVHAYLPATVNSSQLIHIPSEEPASEEDWRMKSIPGIDQYDPLLRVGGVDLLLTPAGDLALGPDGDFRLAYGLTNIIQKVWIALRTPKGSLLHYKDYGFADLLGESTAEVSATELQARLQNLLRGDPTFTGVYGISVLKQGPVVKISFSVGIKGVKQTIPISFDLRR